MRRKIDVVSLIKNTLVLFLAINGFTSMSPYLNWTTYSGYSTVILAQNIIMLLIPILTIVYIYLTKKFVVQINKYIFISVVLCIFAYSYCAFNNLNVAFEDSYIKRAVVICCFLILDRDMQKRAFVTFATIFAISLICGIIVNTLVTFKVQIPYNIIESQEIMKKSKGYYYKHYWGCVILEDPFMPYSYHRLSGMFDESGRVGTVAGLILPWIFTEKEKNRFEKVVAGIIIAGGFMSLSLVFYILFLLMIVYQCMKKRSISTNKMIIGLCCVLGGGLLSSILYKSLLYNTDFQKNFDISIINRFSYSYLINNNRTSQRFDEIFSLFINSDEAMSGMGEGNYVLSSVDAAGYQIVILTFGICGFFLLVLWFMVASVYKCYKYRGDCWIILAFFILSFYQRGWIYPQYHIMILLGQIEAVALERKRVNE